MSEMPKLSHRKASQIVQEWEALQDGDFEELVKRWEQHKLSEDVPDCYKDLRGEMVQIFDAHHGTTSKNNREKYLIDLDEALLLYRSYPQSPSGVSLKDASDDDIWRFLSIKVIPDLTYFRYPDPDKGSVRIAKKRFYSHTRRIWAKTLWWYVYLGWQGDEKKTHDALEGNGTNIISHFIERTGRGYRPELMRAFIGEYADQPIRNDRVFRSAAKLNCAKCQVLEPSLTTFGERGYVRSLFEEIAGGDVSDGS